MRTRVIWVSTLALAIIGGGIAIWGCSHHEAPPVTTTIKPSQERGRHLLQLAAAEGAKIPDVDTRLTRLLNLADQQIQRGWQADAPATLQFAMTTLKSEDARKLSEHARLSGWVSISQLSRQCSDQMRAAEACDGALAALRAIEDPARRCEYVIGVCNEVQYLKGLPTAVKLLQEAGPWTRSIDDVTRRRAAVTAFASALFNFDDYAAGQKMMQYEEDAAWRSATLTQLASLAEPGARPVVLATPAMTQEAPGMPASAAPVYFGKDLSYDHIFKNQRNSQTMRDAKER